jgi:KDO2-lipid IV(A) lauroyltransferase
MLDSFYLISFKIFSFFIKYTPQSATNKFLDFLAFLAYLLDTRHKKIAQVNLDLAYQDKMPQSEKKRIIKKCYKNLLYNMRDFIKNQGISKEELLKKVTVHNEHFYEQAKAYGKGIIFQTAHYGNWELMALSIGAKYGNISVVGRKLDSPKMNTILEKNREQMNVTLLDKNGALRGMMKALKQKENVGLLVDQNTKDTEGILIVFFGKRARHTPSAALMSRKMGTPILPVFITTKDYEHFDLTFYEPFFTPKTDDNEADILASVQKQAAITQQVIEAKPDEWFWFHRRWKNQYEELYK